MEVAFIKVMISWGSWGRTMLRLWIAFPGSRELGDGFRRVNNSKYLRFEPHLAEIRSLNSAMPLTAGVPLAFCFKVFTRAQTVGQRTT